MSRANDMAFPIQESDLAGSIPAQHGLTIREHFAAMAMQGWLSSGTALADSEEKIPQLLQYVARFSVQTADALIAALAKPVTP